MYKTRAIIKLCIVIAISSVLSACGGGGDSGSSSPAPVTSNPSPASNVAPIIDDMAAQTVFERGQFSFTASASDSDGSINNQSWVQKSGMEVVNTTIDGASLSFKAPSVVETQTVVFTFLATDDDAAESQKDLTITIDAFANITDVSIPDVALKSCINDLGESDPARADVGLFDEDSQLSCANRGITDLTGLEVFKDATQLVLSDNQIVDLTPIANLTKVHSLFLGNNKVDSITALNNLTALRQLDLFNNELTSLEGLPIAPNLPYLDVNNNQLASLSGIESLTELTTFKAQNNQLITVNELSALTQLALLDLANNQLTNLDGLETLIQLETLELTNNQLTNVNGLETLTQLKQLSLSNNPLEDISALPKASQVESLWLFTQDPITYRKDMPLSDLSGLANLTGLKTLSIEGDNIIDISPISALTNLQELSLVTYQVEDISVLANLTNLHTVKLRSYTTPQIASTPEGYELEMKLTDLSPLTQLNGLTTLEVQLTAVQDFSSISQLNTLENLSISGNRSTSFAPFANLTNLRSLIFFPSSNDVDNDIEQLSQLSKLHTLQAVWPEQLSNLNLLKNMPQLTNIGIIGNLNSELVDFTVISDYAGQLTTFWVSGTKLADVSFLTNFTALTNLQLQGTKSLNDLSPLQSLSQLNRLNLWFNDHLPCEQIAQLEVALVNTSIERPNACVAD